MCRESNHYSQRLNGMTASLLPTPSTPTTTSSKPSPSFLTSVMRRIFRDRLLKRHVSANLQASLPTGAKKQASVLQAKVNSGNKLYTMLRKSAAKTLKTRLVTISKLDGPTMLGHLNLNNSTTVEVPSSSLGTIIMASSPTYLHRALMTAKCTCWRTQTWSTKTAR